MCSARPRFGPISYRCSVAPCSSPSLSPSLRLVLSRRALRSRVRFELLPADTFDPSLDAIRRFAAQLARTRRGFLLGWLERPGSAVRILIAPDGQGVLRYRLEVPERARTALEAALTAYSQLEARECDPLALPERRGRRCGSSCVSRTSRGSRSATPVLTPTRCKGSPGCSAGCTARPRARSWRSTCSRRLPAQSRRFRKRLFKDAARRAGVQSAGALDGLLGQQRSGRGGSRRRTAVDRLFQTRALAAQARRLRPVVRHPNPALCPRPRARSACGR